MAGISRSGRILLFTTALLLFTTAAAFGNDNDTRLSVFLDGSWVFPIGISLHPGAELSFYTFDLGEKASIGIGAAVPGQIAFASRTDLWSFTTLGLAVAPLLTLSFDSQTGDANRFLERVTFSLSPGIGFNYYIYSGDPAYYANRDTFQIGFAGFAGLRVRVARFVSIRLDTTYWGRYIGPNIALGVQVTL